MNFCENTDSYLNSRVDKIFIKCDKFLDDNHSFDNCIKFLDKSDRFLNDKIFNLENSIRKVLKLQ